jgi:hypothetical protein
MSQQKDRFTSVANDSMTVSHIEQELQRSLTTAHIKQALVTNPANGSNQTPQPAANIPPQTQSGKEQ